MGQITLSKVTKSFGEVTVIPPLDLRIENGEFDHKVDPGDHVHIAKAFADFRQFYLAHFCLT